MLEPVASPLVPWENFYVIVGSSAAALTGLMFVVIALVADHGRVGSQREIGAFGTPTVVHFCAALLVSATLSAPWRVLSHCGMALGVLGVAGAAYVLIVLQRARHQTGYVPVFEDWLWHTILPLVSYLALVVAAFMLSSHPPDVLFAVGGATVLLVFIGIHNAWDTVTYIALDARAAGGGRPPE